MRPRSLSLIPAALIPAALLAAPPLATPALAGSAATHTYACPAGNSPEGTPWNNDIAHFTITVSPAPIGGGVTRCALAHDVLNAAKWTSGSFSLRGVPADVARYGCVTKNRQVGGRDELDQRVTCTHAGAHANTVRFDHFA